MNRQDTVPFLKAHEIFPPVTQALGKNSSYPGLLAAGGVLDAETLACAYAQGIFPWYEQDCPILWWSTNPRMVLFPKEFKLRRSLRKTLQRFVRNPECSIRINSNFEQVIKNCAAPRTNQAGTWITQDIIAAYTQLHQRGLAHSIETWVKDELVGGLYVVALGQAVFGESMFTKQTDASKIALSALVCLCLSNNIKMIDCQQETEHMAGLGARTIDRQEFIHHVKQASQQTAISWEFQPILWQQINLFK